MFFSFIRWHWQAYISVEKNVGIDVDMRPLCDVTSDLTPDIAVRVCCRAAEQTLGV